MSLTPTLVGVLSYIPSPHSNGLSLGPVHFRVYGLLIAIGVFAAVWLADRRWQARGGTQGTLSSIAVWAVPGGLVGARLYHVVSDYQLYTDHPLDALKIWQGGLGIWGGVAGGVLAGYVYVRRHHLDFGAILDCTAPALPLAQAIGRVGNYFNQELYGRPTKLPWAVRIDAVNRRQLPLRYQYATTFHPTFLYELLWDLVVVGLLLWAEKRFRLRKGYLFVLYVALYTFGRFFTEYLRIDPAHRIAGLRLNDWTSVIIFGVSAGVLLRRGRAGPDDGAAADGALVDQPAEPEPEPVTVPRVVKSPAPPPPRPTPAAAAPVPEAEPEPRVEPTPTPVARAAPEPQPEPRLTPGAETVAAPRDPRIEPQPVPAPASAPSPEPEPRIEAQPVPVAPAVPEEKVPEPSSAADLADWLDDLPPAP